MKKIIISLLIFTTTLSVTAQVNTNRVMTIGKNALYFEDYVLAIQYFNQVVSAKPYLADPYYYRAMAKFMLDDFKGAEEDADLCLERNPYYTAAYQLRGASRQNQDKFLEAASDYKRSLEFFPEDRLTLVNMGIVNAEMKEYETADKFFEVLLRRFPDYSPGYLTRAQMYLEMQDTVKALQNIEKAIEVDPYTAQSFSARGVIYLQQKEYNKALADLDEAIRLDPYFEGNYINRGLVKYHLNDLRGAMADYDRVIEMDEDNLIARFNRGLLRSQVADNNRAIKDFDKVIELEPTNTIAYLNRAMLHNEIGNLPEAINDLNRVLEEHPDFFTGYYMRADLKRQLNDLRGAEKDYLLARNEEAKARKIATVDAEDGRKIAKKSDTKDTREQTDTDIEKFNLLVIADKKTTEQSKNKYQRETRGKVQDRNTQIALEPKFVLTYYEKRLDVRRPVYYSESLEKANQNLNLNWTLKMVNNELPLNEFQVKTHFQSIENYSKLISQSPDNESLYFGRGIDFALLQDYESALKDFNKVIELNQRNTNAYFARAVILTKQVELDPIEPEPIKAEFNEITISQTTQTKKSTVTMPEISVKSKRYDEVKKDYDIIIELNSADFYAYYNRAEIFFIEKDYRAAIADYNKAIELQPDFAEAFFNRGISRLSIGETASGLDDLRKAGELGIVQSYSIIKRMQ